MRRTFAASDTERSANRVRLEAIKARVLAEVPGAAVSADQAYREADLAIDFCEDVAPLGTEAVERIKTIFEEAGAITKISSIHVNGWFGQYDKLSMTRRFAWDVAGLNLTGTMIRSSSWATAPTTRQCSASSATPAASLACVISSGGWRRSLPM